jgi:hypothetical protein
LRLGYEKDPFFAPLWNGTKDSINFKKYDSLLFRKRSHGIQQLCIPEGPYRLKLLEEAHDSNTANHPGIQRTTLRLSQWYFWPTLSKDARKYTESCETCLRWKTSSLKQMDC